MPVSFIPDPGGVYVAIFKCESCGYEREVPGNLLGKKAKCPDCGHGVTIVDTLPEVDESFEDAFEETDDILDEEIEAVHGEADNVSESFDLDEVDTELDFEPEDVICIKCGEVIQDGNQDVCPVCGTSVVRAEEFPELSEEDVDVSDLAETAAPQLWDDDYQDSDGGKSLLDADETSVADGWRFFEGSLMLNIFAGLVSGVLNFSLRFPWPCWLPVQKGCTSCFHLFLPLH